MTGVTSWFFFCLVLLIILFVICFINICIHYPGILEFTCGKTCMAWNNEDVDMDSKDGDFYNPDDLEDSSEDEADEDIERRVLPLLKEEDEKKSFNCEIINEIDEVQPKPLENEFDKKCVQLHLIQTQKSKDEDETETDGWEDFSDDDHSLSSRVLPILKEEDEKRTFKCNVHLAQKQLAKLENAVKFTELPTHYGEYPGKVKDCSEYPVKIGKYPGKLVESPGKV